MTPVQEREMTPTFLTNHKLHLYTHTDVVPTLTQLRYIDASGTSRQSSNLIVAVLQFLRLKYILYNTARWPVAIADAT